jgi:hypothetical protein
MRHPRVSRIPPIGGFHRKTRQTRRFAAGRGFLRCDCGLNHKQPGDRTPRRPGVSGGRNLLPMKLAHPSELRVQYLYCALARFRWLFFGASRTLSLGIAQTKRRMHETRTRIRSAGSFDAAEPLQPGRSDRANFPANDFPEPHEVMTLGRTVEIANGQ